MVAGSTDRQTGLAHKGDPSVGTKPLQGDAMTDTIAAAREKLAGVIGEWVSFNTAWSPEGMADAILAAFPELTAPNKDMVKGAQEVIGKWMALTPAALNCAQDVAAFATACVAREREACAKIAEASSLHPPYTADGAQASIAAAIRARKP